MSKLPICVKFGTHTCQWPYQPGNVPTPFWRHAPMLISRSHCSSFLSRELSSNISIRRTLQHKTNFPRFGLRRPRKDRSWAESGRSESSSRTRTHPVMHEYEKKYLISKSYVKVLRWIPLMIRYVRKILEASDFAENDPILSPLDRDVMGSFSLSRQRQAYEQMR
jgi:hypothetical protein